MLGSNHLAQFKGSGKCKCFILVTDSSTYPPSSLNLTRIFFNLCSWCQYVVNHRGDKNHGFIAWINVFVAVISQEKPVVEQQICMKQGMNNEEKSDTMLPIESSQLTQLIKRVLVIVCISVDRRYFAESITQNLSICTRIEKEARWLPSETW